MVKFKLIDEKAQVPVKQGFTYIIKALNEHISIGVAGSAVVYTTGVEAVIPDGYVGFLIPSEEVANTTLVMQDGFKILTGKVDEITITYKGLLTKNRKFNSGDNVARLVIMPDGQEKK